MEKAKLEITLSKTVDVIFISSTMEKDFKQNIMEDSEAYAEEHKNDLRYVEYNKQFEEREKALQDDANRKKRKPPKLMGE